MRSKETGLLKEAAISSTADIPINECHFQNSKVQQCVQFYSLIFKFHVFLTGSKWQMCSTKAFQHYDQVVFPYMKFIQPSATVSVFQFPCYQLNFSLWPITAKHNQVINYQSFLTCTIKTLLQNTYKNYCTFSWIFFPHFVFYAFRIFRAKNIRVYQLHYSAHILFHPSHSLLTLSAIFTALFLRLR